ncbi:hypothetical protein [Streptomyces sp. 8N706]
MTVTVVTPDARRGLPGRIQSSYAPAPGLTGTAVPAFLNTADPRSAR